MIRTIEPTQFSIVIPTYNASSYILAAITSVISQGGAANQIIVVDDGSADDTVKFVETFGDRVTCVTQRNQGASVARNRGIEMAKYEWIAFLDADDTWAPQKLQSQAALIERQPSIGWAACNYNTIKAEQSEPAAAPLVHEAFRGQSVLNFFAAAKHEVPMQTSGFIVRRGVFKEVGVFDARLRVCQDRDLWWRIAMKHPRIGYIDQPLYNYRIDNPTSLMGASKDRSESVMSLCENVARARTAYTGVKNPFESYARSLLFDYLLRQQRRTIRLNQQIVARALKEVGLHPADRGILTVAQVLPRLLLKALIRLREAYSSRYHLPAD